MEVRKFIFLFLSILFSCFSLQAQDLGVNATDGGVEFSLYSENATRIELWIFKDPYVVTPIGKYELTRGSNNVWKVVVADATVGTYYGYRVWGPNWPYSPDWQPGTAIGFISDVDKDGNRFNPNKLLLDPYARSISHDPKDGGYLTGAEERNIDTAKGAPKGIVVDNSFQWDGDKPINRNLNESIVYEVHLRGMTQSSTSGAFYEGTYKGITEKAQYLKDLGVTAVEFLPVQETINDYNGLDNNPKDDNYWGYMTLNYFSPDRRYSYDKSPSGPVKEFKEMVKVLHQHGIEVIMDVVYNHTAEGGTAGTPSKACLFTFRGIDNQVYYELTKDNQYYWDNTGCGSNMRFTHPQVQKFVVDSLKYWVEEMHVDGFRFDLASVLGNTIDKHGYQFSRDSALLRKIREAMPKTKMIAEPWACGDGTYQVGNFPDGWAEWNGKFRDCARKFILMEPGTLSELATRLCGSSDLYQDDGRKPYHSINFITAHDGFTLFDLVAYDSKNNQQSYPYGPSDGGEDNNNCRNWYYDWLKLQHMRNFGCVLFLAQGTPMILGGDEFARTQRGNNNAYNLDTICSWLDWTHMNSHERLWKFFQGLIAFRKSHGALCRANFFTGRDNNGDSIPDIQWHGCNYLTPDWTSSSLTLAYRLDGSSQETGASQSHGDIYIMINNWREMLSFQLPPNKPGKKWYRVLDTANWAENADTIQNNIEISGQEDLITDGTWTDVKAQKFAGNSTYLYGLSAHSISVFIEK